jgi:hypothetical protein
MTLYIVHLPGESPSDQARLLRAELVKDGFHWWAFLLPLPWLLVNRIWWGLLAYIALAVGMMLLGRAITLPGETLTAFELLVGLFVGLVAGDLKSWQLGRRGYRVADVVSGRDQEEAERRFFDRAMLARSGEAAPKGAAVRPAAAFPTAPHQSATGASPVIGLFPEAGGTR